MHYIAPTCTLKRFRFLVGQTFGIQILGISHFRDSNLIGELKGDSMCLVNELDVRSNDILQIQGARVAPAMLSGMIPIRIEHESVSIISSQKTVQSQNLLQHCWI